MASNLGLFDEPNKNSIQPLSSKSADMVDRNKRNENH